MNRVKDATDQLGWNLYFYMRYVDDCNCVGEELPLGSRVHNGKVIIKPECIEEDKQIPGDIRTARVMQKN